MGSNERPLCLPSFAPAIRVSSDTDGSAPDGSEPSTSAGHRRRRARLPSSNSHTMTSLDVQPSNSVSARTDYSVAFDDLNPESYLLDKASLSAEVVSHLDSFSSESVRVENGIKYIDETPRGISDTARSSFVPPHLLNIPFPHPPRPEYLSVGNNNNAYDPLRRAATYASGSARGGSSRSLEKGVQIQEQLHRLVSAFHERARQVKEQVVVQPPSPTLSPEVEEKSLPTQTIPLNQMPIRQPSPSRSMRGEQFTGLPVWCSKFRLFRPFEPQSGRYLTWLFVISLAFIYNAYAIPYRAAFLEPSTDENQRWWYLADYICDFLYLVDILVFKISVKFVMNGIWVENRKDILRRYVRSWRFRLDLLASFPFDIFYLIPAVDKNPLLRITKLLKLPSYWEFQSRIDQVARSPHILRVMNSLAYMIWMIHANGCLFYYISYLEGFDSNHWVYSHRFPAYLHCFWRSFIVATAVGNAPEPENIVENAYMIFSWLVGVFVFALLIGQIRDIFTQMTYQEDHYQATVDAAIRYLQNLRMPKSMQKKLRAWFHYNWEQHKTLDENSLLDGLPKKLKTDLVLSVHYNTLCKVQLLQGTDQSLLRDLVLKLKPVVFLPDDYICKRGEVGKEMYIVRSGYLEVITPDGKVVASLTEGSVFGEISLLSLVGGNRRTADVKSKGYSNLYVLSKADLHEVLRDYPETQEILKKKAQRLYQRLTPTDERKTPPRVEIIKSRTPTPSMVRTVLTVMDPKSSLVQRLSKTIQPQTFPQLIAQTDISSEEDIILPDSDGEHKVKSPLTPRPAPDIVPLMVPETIINRSPSAENIRKRRELQLQHQKSSDSDLMTKNSDQFLRPRSRRHARSPGRSPRAKSPPPPPRSRSPAPIANLEEDSPSPPNSHETQASFLPSFLTVPLKRLFQRPKIAPIISVDGSSISEPVEQVEMISPQRKSRPRQIFRLPSNIGGTVIGTRPPSVASEGDSNYNLDIGPPDLEESSSSDFSHPANRGTLV